MLTNVRVVLVLGQIAFNAHWRVQRERGRIDDLVKRPKFAHGARYRFGSSEPTLLVSYHPSRQNTQTGRLTKDMFHEVFATARSIVDTPAQG